MPNAPADFSRGEKGRGELCRSNTEVKCYGCSGRISTAFPRGAAEELWNRKEPRRCAFFAAGSGVVALVVVDIAVVLVAVTLSDCRVGTKMMVPQCHVEVPRPSSS